MPLEILIVWPDAGHSFWLCRMRKGNFDHLEELRVAQLGDLMPCTSVSCLGLSYLEEGVVGLVCLTKNWNATDQSWSRLCP